MVFREAAGAHLRAGGWERYAPACTLAVIGLLLGVDLVEDVASGKSALHVTAMAAGTVLSIAGVALVARWIRLSRERARDLATTLGRTRASPPAWSAAAVPQLPIAGVVERQFSEWGLALSEREIGVLLLKGVPLNEIAASRGAPAATVRQQAQAIYRKADVAGRAELAAFFLEGLGAPRARDPGEASARFAREPGAPVNPRSFRRP